MLAHRPLFLCDCTRPAGPRGAPHGGRGAARGLAGSHPPDARRGSRITDGRTRAGNRRTISHIRPYYDMGGLMIDLGLGVSISIGIDWAGGAHRSLGGIDADLPSRACDTLCLGVSGAVQTRQPESHLAGSPSVSRRF